MSEVESIKRHVKHLAVTIGPRGSTTLEEKAAAEYAEQVYRDLGLSPLTEMFTSAKSAWLPFALGTGLILVAELIFWSGIKVGMWIAAILALFALVSLILELLFIPNPIRWILPKGISQNVSVRLAPLGEKRGTIILMGHLDTHRTPFIYGSKHWFDVFSSMTTTTFFCAILLAVTFLVRIVLEWRILDLISVLLSMPVLFIFLTSASADSTPYTHGANDNASGTSIVMGLVERLMKSPLQNTAVWAVNTGCEEVGAYGAAAWIGRHRDELDGAILLTLDNVGGRVDGPCYLTKETLIFPFSSDPNLVKLATELAVDHPSLKARKCRMKAAYTEGAIGNRAGLRCLTFVNYRLDGVIPNWHQQSDTIDNIDWDVIQRTEEFVWLLIQAIDRYSSKQFPFFMVEGES